MSSGYTTYTLEQLERSRLAAAERRRSELLFDLDLRADQQRRLGLKAAEFWTRDGNSTEVEEQCREIEALIQRADVELADALARREREAGRQQLARAISGVTVSPELPRLLGPTAPATPVDDAQLRRRDLAEQVVARQDVADPEIAERVAAALAESPERADMLLGALRDEVDRRNTRHRATLAATARARREEIDRLAKAEAKAEDERFVAQVVRESFQAMGYQVADATLEGNEDALVVRSGAHPDHAVMARLLDDRIKLDTVRLSGASDLDSDKLADQALCDGLAAFRAELEKRGVKPTRANHVPAGLVPVASRTLTARTRDQAADQAARRQR